MSRTDAEQIERLTAELAKSKHPVDSYACQRCGRADGLDAVVPNHIWATITGGRLLTTEVVGGRWNLLCLWCIDELCLEHGVKCVVSLHFAGRTVAGTSQSDADAEQIARLADERDALMAVLVRKSNISNRYIARVPYRAEGYAGGRWAENPLVYYFPDRPSAEAAAWEAAGLATIEPAPSEAGDDSSLPASPVAENTAPAVPTMSLDEAAHALYAHLGCGVHPHWIASIGVAHIGQYNDTARIHVLLVRKPMRHEGTIPSTWHGYPVATMVVGEVRFCGDGEGRSS